MLWDDPPTRRAALRRGTPTAGPHKRPASPRLAKRAEVGPQTLSFPVVIGAGSHPFPFRTRKLSLLPPMVLRA
jgi:hypothetical protein